VPKIRLGLIGDNIAASRSPELHRAAGRICGLDVTYDLLVPRDLKLDFGAVFEHAVREGYRGLNITYPHKETVIPRVRIDDPDARPIAACNTVVFAPAGAIGTNTDYSGFLDAFRACFGPAAPGTVAMAGSGGVGKAIGFALARLGARSLRLFDTNRPKAGELASALAAIYPAVDVEIAASIEQASDGADGLVNCTPLGMIGYGGSAFPAAVLGRRHWAFDAVYTPVETPFLLDARSAGLSIMSGYELLFHQGINAFRIFTGREIDPAALRRALAGPDAKLRGPSGA
jgi:shikimate dehydrogenase